MPLSQNSLNNGARWEVLWVRPKGGWARKAFDQDFSAALRTHNLLLLSGRKGVTLRSCNVGFPLPKRYEKKISRLNARGVYWCPYCITLRRFALDDYKRFMYCPVCDATTGNFHVRQTNPKATVIGYRRTRRVRNRTGRRVRRRAK